MENVKRTVDVDLGEGFKVYGTPGKNGYDIAQAHNQPPGTVEMEGVPSNPFFVANHNGTWDVEPFGNMS